MPEEKWEDAGVPGEIIVVFYVILRVYKQFYTNILNREKSRGRVCI